MIDRELEQFAQLLGTKREDVKRHLQAAERSEEGARIAKNVLRAKLRRSGIDVSDNDPFQGLIAPEDLAGDGVWLGSLAHGQGDLIWRHTEIAYSAVFLGGPGFGKTSAIIHLLIQLARFYTIILVCLRGDYECLCRILPSVRFFIVGRFPINLLKGPQNMSPSVFNQRFLEVFTDQFDQYQASRRYLNLMLDMLELKRRETGHWSCLPDLRDALEQKKEDRGSDELRFRNRCLARVDALIRALGEDCVGIEQGIDLDYLFESGQTIIIRADIERSIQDFLVNWLLMYAFEKRTCTDNKFQLKPLIFVLDEQRSILRLRR